MSCGRVKKNKASSSFACLAFICSFAKQTKNHHEVSHFLNFLSYPHFYIGPHSINILNIVINKLISNNILDRIRYPTFWKSHELSINQVKLRKKVYYMLIFSLLNLFLDFIHFSQLNVYYSKHTFSQKKLQRDTI